MGGTMTTGIIVYSYTGHTLSLVQQLVSQMEQKANIFTLEPAGQMNLSALKTPIKSVPDISSFDTAILATPVHGGRMSSPMATFLDETQDLLNKKVILLSTHFFPHAWGCKQMFSSMREICENKGAQVVHEGDLYWPGLTPRVQLHRLIKRTIGLVE